MGTSLSLERLVVGGGMFAVGTALFVKYGINDIANAFDSFRSGDYASAFYHSLRPLVAVMLMEEGEGLVTAGYLRLFRRRR